MAKDTKKKKVEAVTGTLESILDLNSNNVWQLDEHDIRRAWETEDDKASFLLAEDKILNTIRLCFEVVHYNPDDKRDRERYENGEWSIFEHCNEAKGWVAIRKKHITRLNDLSYENISHITAPALLELIDRNFGGGWDSVSLSIKDIIQSVFDISTTTLPEKRMHMEGGTLAKKIAQGFDVLEIPKGTWIEAIFAKKREPSVKLHATENRYDEDGNLLPGDEDDFDKDLPNSDVSDDDVEEEIDDDKMDETFYSSYTETGSDDPTEQSEDLEGLSIEDE